MKKIAVKFIRSCAPYNAGEVAGFSQSIAVNYVRKGYAKLYVKNEIEIPVEKPETEEEPQTNKGNAEIAALLLGTKQEILESILAVDDNGEPIVSDVILCDLLFCERQGRNRKTVVKAIEDVSFDRIRSR